MWIDVFYVTVLMFIEHLKIILFHVSEIQASFTVCLLVKNSWSVKYKLVWIKVAWSFVNDEQQEFLIWH